MATPMQHVVRAALVLLGSIALLVAPTTPAHAHGDRERTEKMRSEYSSGTNIPLITSGNVDLVATKPGSRGSRGAS